MFTGLIEGTGTVIDFRGTSRKGGLLHVGEVPWGEPVRAGESIAVNGVCLTAVDDRHDRTFRAQLSPETLQRSNLGDLKTGDPVNLERPLRLGDRLGGHLVQGHVDGVGTFHRVREAGDFRVVEVEIPRELRRYIIEKGSIAVDGISLTVASLVADNRIKVAIIPKTWELTNLSARKLGDRVNLEVDLIGKYVENLMIRDERGDGLSASFLKKHGFF